MLAKRQSNSLSRRQFVRQGVAAAGFLGAAAGVKAGDRAANPFAYDVSRLMKINPGLVHYQQARQILSPRPNPRRLAIGPDDRLCLAADNYLNVLDAQGVPVLEIGLPSAAQCVAVSADSHIFVGLKDHIEVFDAKGQRRATWDGPGPRAWFTGLAVAGDSIFAADAGNRVVLRYDRSGKLLARIGLKNKSRNIPGFIVPSPFFDVEMHSDGLLRVTNPGRHRVEAYTPDGDFELAWGKPSNSIDGFCGCCNPINISLLPDGRIVTCEKGLARVKVYANDGAFVSVVAGPESFPENVGACSGISDCTHGGLDSAVDSNGRIYILDLVKADIRVMEAKPASVSSPG